MVAAQTISTTLFTTGHFLPWLSDASICVCAKRRFGVGIVALAMPLHLLCGVCSYLSKQFDLPAPWVISLLTTLFSGK